MGSAMAAAGRRREPAISGYEYRAYSYLPAGTLPEFDLAPEFGIPRPHCPVTGTMDFVTETTITGIRHDQVDVKGRLALIGQPSDLPHF